MHIDINCDVGEGIGNESLLMPFISSANIACGFHAGDEDEMKRMVALCLHHDVAIGAHPSFPDKVNFGRINMHLTPAEIHSIITEQLSTLNEIVTVAGAKLHHVKPHGALYNMAAKDSVLASAIAEAVKDFDSNLIYYGLSGSLMTDEAVKFGLRISQEVFADRTYQPDGSLTSRTAPGALIKSAEQAVRQVMQMITERKVIATNGENISIKADTVCIHGDGPNAVELAKDLYRRLTIAGIQIKKIT